MKTVAIDEAWQRKYPEQVALVTSLDNAGKPNIITLGWVMQTSKEPSMIAISVGNTRYSHKLISETGEFVMAFPTEELKGAVEYCGKNSGRDVDKFQATGLTPKKAQKVKPPLIEECLANFECKVVGTLVTGDHTIFVGEVLAAHVSDERRPRVYNFGNGEFKGVS